MEKLSLDRELKENAYPGRGIVIGISPDGKKAVTAYFIMGRSSNSRNRIFVECEDGTVRRPLIPQSWRIRVLSSMPRFVYWEIIPLLQMEIRRIPFMTGCGMD